MRIKINDKIYRLKEIESGADSLMELVEEPKYKDGDFVVNKAGSILIFKEKVGDCIYGHAFLIETWADVYFIDGPSITQIERHATEEEKQKLLDALAKKGKRWNAEKKCIEDIPKRKFKVGDKVRIKDGVSSKTHESVPPFFSSGMDGLIGHTMTVSGYTDESGYVVCNEAGWGFREDWLEPYAEELKKGDLAIFWQFDKTQAVVKLFDNEQGDVFQTPFYVDNAGHWWANAIKFEGKEQFEKLLKGEI